jgi:glycosyltransferase involved in cell wall biosynthesis
MSELDLQKWVSENMDGNKDTDVLSLSNLSISTTTTNNSDKFRFHILCVPFMLANEENSICAFTQKMRKFSKMMTEKGHHTIVYAQEGADVCCTELVPVLSVKKDFSKFYKFEKSPPYSDPKYVAQDHWPLTKLYNERVIAAIESYAIMHNIYGKYGIDRPRCYDAVIPNYFDPADFTFSEEGGKYFLFLGRVIESKGIEIIIELARQLPLESFVVAGPGSFKESGFTNIPSNIVEIGPVNTRQRNNLMGNAKAFVLPTLYIEPFGGAAMEAMFCGVPTISSDWGVFSETVIHGITGYRCRLMDHFVYAAKNITKISRKACREWAMKNYSLEAVYPMYAEWFQNVKGVHIQRSDGTFQDFYSINAERKEMNWLAKKFPTDNINHNINGTETVVYNENSSALPTTS